MDIREMIKEIFSQDIPNVSRELEIKHLIDSISEVRNRYMKDVSTVKEELSKRKCLLFSEEFSDVVFKSDCYQKRLHKVVLFGRSKYFQNIISSEVVVNLDKKVSYLCWTIIWKHIYYYYLPNLQELFIHYDNLIHLSNKFRLEMLKNYLDEINQMNNFKRYMNKFNKR
jgi:hypothetical protein